MFHEFFMLFATKVIDVLFSNWNPFVNHFDFDTTITDIKAHGIVGFENGKIVDVSQPGVTPLIAINCAFHRYLPMDFNRAGCRIAVFLMDPELENIILPRIEHSSTTKVPIDYELIKNLSKGAMIDLGIRYYLLNYIKEGSYDRDHFDTVIRDLGFKNGMIEHIKLTKSAKKKIKAEIKKFLETQ